MNVRFHTNPDGEPHVHDHGVAEDEVLEALARPLEQISGSDESTILIGRTVGGRVLKVFSPTPATGMVYSSSPRSTCRRSSSARCDAD